MRISFILCFFVLSAISQLAWSQCPPAGFPESGNTCPTAPIICGNIDGYCATINNSNTPQSFPGCPGWQLNNDEWIAFVAGSNQISIQVIPSNCMNGGNNTGLQGAIYGRCISQPIDLQCSCTVNPFVLESSNFEVGKTYYLVLDGCGGNVCDYAISLLSGSTIAPKLTDPGDISGPTLVCTGSQTIHSIPTVAGAGTYTWTMSSPLGDFGKETNNTKSIKWTNTGFTTLCVKTSNACESNPKESCKALAVSLGLNALISGKDTLCNGQTADLSISFAGQQGPWSFVYSIDSIALPMITTNQNPHIISVNQPGVYRLVSVVADTNSLCKGLVSGEAIISNVIIDIAATIKNATQGVSNGDIRLTVSNGIPPYTYKWSNGSTLQNISGLWTGTYTVTVTDATDCSYAKTYFVDAVSDAVEAQMNTFRVSPNPTSGSLQVSFHDPVPANGWLRLFDAQGRLAGQWLVPQGTDLWSIDMGGLASGVYALVWGEKGIRIIRR